MGTHAYVARRKCGCVVTLIADCGDHDTATDVAQQIRDGFTIERVAIERVRSGEIGIDVECLHIRRDAEGR